MRNDQTRIYREQRGNWTDVHPDILIDDWDNIGERMAFNAASRATLLNTDGTRKTHRDPYVPKDYRPVDKTPRKMMKVSEGLEKTTLIYLSKVTILLE